MAGNSPVSRRSWSVILGAAGLACGAVAWQAGARSLTLAEDWIGVRPIGQMYSHRPEEYPRQHLGDVPPPLVEPRSLGDTRVRQYDELDRPRFAQRLTHRGAQLNSERFTVVAMTGEEDASLAMDEFNASWEEFSRLADIFTADHRNPDFGIGQVLIVIDNQPAREQDLPLRTLQIENGQTIVYINVAEGQPSLAEQLPELRQGAVHALLHLAELDRKFPLWVQQGLAEYTAAKIEAARQAAAERAQAEESEGLDPGRTILEPEYAEDAFTADVGMDEEDRPFVERANSLASMTPIGTEYWRLQRVAPDRLAEPDAAATSDALERVTFLLEGDDAEHAPEFLLSLRDLAQQATDPLLASRAQLVESQLLPPAAHTSADELFEELEEAYASWQEDPLRGQPLFVPGGEISDPAMLTRQKEMEVVLKLASRMQQATSETAIRPRVTEFGAAGAVDAAVASVIGQAIDIERLYYNLLEAEIPWATRDADGQLLLWIDDDKLAGVLGLDENRYTSEFRDGKWVLVTAWDDSTQLEAWLEPNENNPTRPLMKFAARPRAEQVRVSGLDDGAQLR